MNEKLTTLKQNERSAIDTNKRLVKIINQLQNQLKNAISDMREVLDTNDVCKYCAYKIDCPGDKSCEGYIEGIGVEDAQGNKYDWKWTCMDLDYGTCDKMEGTPCEGCDFKNHFKWRGLD